MVQIKSRRAICALTVALLTLAGCGGGRGGQSGDKASTPGISSTSIKLGGSIPLTGSAAAFSVLAKSADAYFRYVNKEQGGVNGRQIEYEYLDDAYDPGRTVQNVRRLVEQDQVLAIFQVLGTPTNMAIWDYLNSKSVPQLYSSTSSDAFGKALVSGEKPWSMTFNPPFDSEAATQASYLASLPGKHTAAFLYQNDSFGQSVVKAFEPALKAVGIETVAKESFAATDPSVDSQVVALASSKADILINWNNPTPAAQAIRKANQVGWSPKIVLSDAANSIGSVLKPAGLVASKGVLSNAYQKDPSDPQWNNDAGIKEYRAALAKYAAGIDPADPLAVEGYAQAFVMVAALKGLRDPTRKSLMDSVLNMNSLEVPVLVPGISVHTTPKCPWPITTERAERFDGTGWVLVGDPVHTKPIPSCG